MPITLKWVVYFPPMAWYAENHLTDAMQRYGLDIGDRTQAFLKGVRWLFPVAFITRFLTGLASIAVAVYLGPSNIGLVNLALAAALWIQIPLFFGTPTSLMHYIPSADPDKKNVWTSMGLLLMGSCMGLTLLIGAAWSTTWARLQAIPVQTFRWALLWCGGFAIFSASTAVANAWEQFQFRAVLDMLFTGLYLAGLALCYFLKRLTPLSYVVCMSIGYGISGLIGLVPQLKKIEFIPGMGFRRISSMMLSYGAIASLGTVVTALIQSAGRLVANRYLPLSDVGIISMYQSGTMQVSTVLLSVISQVFFPLASRTPNKLVLLRKMNRAILLTILPLSIGLMSIVFLYFKLLGKHYPFSWSNAGVYAVAALYALLFSLLSWFLATFGRKGTLYASIVGIAVGLTNWGLCLYCIPRWKVLGAGAANVMGGGIGIILCEFVAFLMTNKYLPDKTDGAPA